MLNKVFLQARLVADPEMRTTQNGVAVSTVRIACDRDFKSGNDTADFFSLVAWRQTAEFLSKWFHKGSMIVVDGRLQARQYTDRDGNKRTATEVVADHIYFGDSKHDITPGGNPADVTPPDFTELSDDGSVLPF